MEKYLPTFMMEPSIIICNSCAKTYISFPLNIDKGLKSVGWGERNPMQILYTAKTKYRKFERNIPRNETAWPRSQFLYSYFGEGFIYSHDRSAYSAGGKYVD